MKVGMKFQLNILENGHFMTDFRLKKAIFGVYLIFWPTKNPPIDLIFGVHLGVVLVHPHKKFELNWSKNDRVMADFRPKITFFYRSLYIQLCPIELIFFVELQ
jgi:hypothetical protein